MTPLERALVEQVRAQDEVNRLSKLIGDAISRSFDAQAVPYGIEPTDWLKQAYAMEWEPADSGYGRQRYFVNHEDDVEGYLQEGCRHALQAHMLIQQRKVARKHLGIAKRRLSVMGRKLLKNGGQPRRR